MELLISKADFTAANLVKFSQNILDDQLAPYIYAAQDYDLSPRLGPELYAALEYLADGGSPGHGPGPGAGAASSVQLQAFLDEKVKRYLVLASYRRFISAHGMNVTQFGLTKTADPQGTFNQAEAAERAVIIRQVDADANVALIRMASTPYTFDGISYDKEAKGGQPSASIRAPKRRRLAGRLSYSTYFNLLDNGLY